MNIFFPKTDTQAIVTSIHEAMGDRQLAKIVSIDLEDDDLVVTISKVGTSTLTFGKKSATGGTQFVLKKEKIALAHRAFKDEVKQKIFQVIEQAGGTVTA